MVACSYQVKHHRFRLICIFVSAFIISCNGTNNLVNDKEGCSSVEILSFGSDFDIKCNETYMRFNEMNVDNLNWKFADESTFCQEKGKQQAFVNQCGITRINLKYLKVQLKSLYRREHACIYCPINYKPIAPIIAVDTVNYNNHGSYIFNITATGLEQNESFQIVWAKRLGIIQDSFRYWFLPNCIHSDVERLEVTGHSIVFAINDAPIDRVEFIIRRCNDTCRSYKECLGDESSTDYFQSPNSIEKISCNSDCLDGMISTTTITTTLIKEDVTSINETQTIKWKILIPTVISLIVLLFIILGFFLIYQKKDLRTANVYSRTNRMDFNENK